MGVSIQAGPSHRAQSISCGDRPAHLDKDLIQMGIIEVSPLCRFINPYIVSSPNAATRPPISVDGNYHPGGYRDHFNLFSGAVIQPILILIKNEKVMPRMAFVLVSIEKIIALGFIPIPLFPADGMKGVSTQGKVKSFTWTGIPGSGEISFQGNLQLTEFAPGFFFRDQTVANPGIKKVPLEGRAILSPKRGRKNEKNG